MPVKPTRPRARPAGLRAAALAGLALGLMACTPGGNYAHVTSKFAAADVVSDELVTSQEDVRIIHGDYGAALYQRLGEIRVRLYRINPFVPPREADLDWALRTEAAKLGADAVIFVKYGNRTFAEAEWISLDATGTAVRFLDIQ